MNSVSGVFSPLIAEVIPMTKCIVLHSSVPYSEDYAPLLRKVLDEEPDLFAVVGIDCVRWEEAMDWLRIDLDISGVCPRPFCNTTSHPDESLAAVIAFAEQWCDLKGGHRDVKVLEN